METKTDNRITVEAVLKAIEDGAKSPTAIAKRLGFKSGSSNIIKRLFAAVPDLKERVALNASQADAQAIAKVNEKASEQATAEGKPANPAFPVPDCVPFRRSSGYAMVWAILYAHRQKGINRIALTEQYKAWSGKPDLNCKFDVHVVLSPKEDGSSHRSAAKAAQYYWVERKNDFCRLHLVGKGK